MMKRQKQKQHVRHYRSGKKVLVNRGVKKKSVKRAMRGKLRRMYHKEGDVYEEYSPILGKNVKYRQVAGGFLREPIGLSVEEQSELSRHEAKEQFKDEYGREPESMSEILREQLKKRRKGGTRFVDIPSHYDISELDLPMALASESDYERSFEVNREDVPLISKELEKRGIDYDWDDGLIDANILKSERGIKEPFDNDDEIVLDNFLDERRKLLKMMNEKDEPWDGYVNFRLRTLDPAIDSMLKRKQSREDEKEN